MERGEFFPRASRVQAQFLIAGLRAKSLGIAGVPYSRGRKEARPRFSDCDRGPAADSRARRRGFPVARH
jgi:hypothetical protein